MGISEGELVQQMYGGRVQMRFWRCPNCGDTTWSEAYPECCGIKMKVADPG